MASKRFELKVKKSLFNNKFDGYKLSLRECEIITHQFSIPVKRVLPNNNQHSFLHAKLFGLQNLLISEKNGNRDDLYFIDINLNICKISINNYTNTFDDILILWKIPNDNSLTLTNGYNVSLKFVSEEVAILSDGLGILHILHTGNRENDNSWSSLFSGQVLDKRKPFIISDVILKSETEETKLKIILYSIEQEESKMFSLIYWLSFIKEPNAWKKSSEKHLKAYGDISYLYLERKFDAIYVVSEKGCKFVYDSDKPILLNEKHKYKWWQNSENIIVHLNYEEILDRSQIKIDTTNQSLVIEYNNKTLILGTLFGEIDPARTKWDVNENILEVIFYKKQESILWPEVIEGDCNGELLVDDELIEAFGSKLPNVYNDKEDNPPAGITFNSEPVEECDFSNKGCAIFERLCPNTHTVTHRSNLGSNPVLLTAFVNNSNCPLIGIRYDVDVCLWEPTIDENGDFFLKHVDTLLAIGYISASKQQKKFIECPFDLGYVAICESSRHLFLYQQRNLSGELKNRKSGARIQTVAEQQVINIGDKEIIGIHASSTCIYLLTETSIRMIKL